MNNILTKINSHHSGSDIGLYTFLNHYSYLLARKNPDLISSFDEIHCDGIVLCLFLRLIGIHKKRKSFDMTSLAPKIFNLAVLESKSIYFIGGEPKIAQAAVDRIIKAYPQLRVAGIRHGFFISSLEREQNLKEISLKNPDFVIASMGTPYQEQFLIDLKKAGWRGCGYTSGGFFHQTAKAGLRYYPAWVDRFNLRWAFRIADEPKLLKRYTSDFIKFLVLFSYDAFLFKIKKHRT
ncbi:WecB/TagA/CpsF family glycosyltransferase [Pseudomonas sp. A-B-19]|uniref:WecB/TagA/CpsF family glycosyltransferase n=1 Tax=Pseudomonas sp. A-B-19 TaxID=2832405 RepID=UPI001CBD19DA|nr:WecB/TagA/CpsF family glycosyltransferase [Pseudomonas sp. A-B-19]